MVLAMGPFLWGKAWLRLSLNPEPEISPHQNQQRQLQFKRKFFITIMDSNKKHQLSLSLSFFFSFWSYIIIGLVTFKVKRVHHLFRFFIFSTPHFMWLCLFKLKISLIFSLLALISQCLRPDRLRKTFLLVNASVIAPRIIKNKPCSVVSILKE